MGPQARREYAARWLAGIATPIAERSKLLDEFVAVTGQHRKYAIALLGLKGSKPARRLGRPSRFGPEVAAVLVDLWRAMDYPWSRRLQAMLPLWLPPARSALTITATTEALLSGMSARSMDRLLRPHRATLRREIYGRAKPGTLLEHQVPIRSERWDVQRSGVV